MKLYRLLVVPALWLVFHHVQAASFVIQDIEVRGIKKIAIGTVLNYLPTKVGESFDTDKSPQLIRELYKTGFFDNISLHRLGDSLVVEVAERPSIAEVNFDGNKEVSDEIMQDALKQIGITRGKIYNPQLLEKLQQELQQLYYSLGKYSVRLEAKANNLDEDRVQVDICLLYTSDAADDDYTV